MGRRRDKAMKSLKKNRNAMIALIAILVCIAFPLICGAAGQTYPILIMCYLELYIIAVSGLDLLFGYSGQISMGHAAFYAIGAYGSGMLHNYFGIPVFFSMLIATAVATGIGALLALPASRLKFHFLSLATISFGEIVYQLVSHSPNSVTGNFLGLFSDGISIFGIPLNTSTRFAYFGLVFMILFLLLKTAVVNSRVGRAFVAVRENTHAADGMGINVRYYKVLAFALSAMFVAFAGGMFMHLVGYVSPDTFTKKQSVMFMTMLLFGGTACLAGPIMGACAVLLLTELLRAFQAYQMLIYGVLMLIVIVAMPGGLHGSLKDLIANIRFKRQQRKEATNVKG